MPNALWASLVFSMTTVLATPPLSSPLCLMTLAMALCPASWDPGPPFTIFTLSCTESPIRDRIGRNSRATVPWVRTLPLSLSPFFSLLLALLFFPPLLPFCLFFSFLMPFGPFFLAFFFCSFAENWKTSGMMSDSRRGVTSCFSSSLSPNRILSGPSLSCLSCCKKAFSTSFSFSSFLVSFSSLGSCTFLPALPSSSRD